MSVIPLENGIQVTGVGMTPVFTGVTTKTGFPPFGFAQDMLSRE
jgi:hypothetical protein